MRGAAEHDRALEGGQDVGSQRGGVFCAGSDLKAMAAGEFPAPAVDGPPLLGPTRLRLTKPVIAAIEGGAFGGGMELALVNRLVPPGTALAAATGLARQIAALPQHGLTGRS